MELFIGLIIGLIISFIFWGWIYHQHKKSWQQEYRRLMGKIFKARNLIRLKGLTLKDEATVNNKLDYAYKVLSDAYGSINNVRRK
jgi:hypothetical protein